MDYITKCTIINSDHNIKNNNIYIFQTATDRKLELMKTPPQPSTSTSSTSSSLSGYRIVNMNLLAGLFRQLLCPQCKTQSIDLQVKPARGSGTGTVLLVLLAQCEKCNETITSAPTSEITIHALNQIPVYTTPVIKEDCVNHIAKRMKTGIMTLRKSLMGTKDSISGSKKGQVTEKIATKLTNYYSAALKHNAPHLTAMRNAVMASLHRMLQWPNMEKMPKDSRDKQAYSGDSSIHGLFGFQHWP